MNSLLLLYIKSTLWRGVGILAILWVLEKFGGIRMVRPNWRWLYALLIVLTLMPFGRLEHAGKAVDASPESFRKIVVSSPKHAVPAVDAAFQLPDAAAEPVVFNVIKTEPEKYGTAEAKNAFQLPHISLAALLGFIYAAIAALLVWRQVRCYRAWRKKVNGCPVVGAGRVFELFCEARRLGSFSGNVVLRDSGNIFGSPASFGFGAGRTVLVPLREMAGLSDQAVLMLLLHELAHLANGDNSGAFFWRAVADCCFFNYFIRIFTKRMELIREMDCDAAVMRLMPQAVSGRADYAELLLNSHLRVSVVRNMPGVGFGASSFELKQRIKELAMKKRKCLMLLVVFIAVVGMGCVMVTPSCWSLGFGRTATGVAGFNREYLAGIMPDNTSTAACFSHLADWSAPSPEWKWLSPEMVGLFNAAAAEPESEICAAITPDDGNGAFPSFMLIKSTDSEKTMSALTEYLTTLPNATRRCSFSEKVELPVPGVDGKVKGVRLTSAEGDCIMTKLSANLVLFKRDGVGLTGLKRQMRDDFIAAFTDVPTSAFLLTSVRPGGSGVEFGVPAGNDSIPALISFENSGSNITIVFKNDGKFNDLLGFAGIIAEKLYAVSGGTVNLNTISDSRGGQVLLRANFSADQYRILQEKSGSDAGCLAFPLIFGAPKPPPLSELIDRFDRQMSYNGRYANVRDVVLADMILNNYGQEGADALRSFADKREKILTGDVIPLSGLGYESGYLRNNCNTDEQRTVTTVQLLMADIAFVNNILQTPRRTADFFRELEKVRPTRAKYAWYVVRDDVMDAGDYATAEKYYSDPLLEYRKFEANTLPYTDGRDAHAVALRKIAGHLAALARYQHNDAAANQIEIELNNALERAGAKNTVAEKLNAYQNSLGGSGLGSDGSFALAAAVAASGPDGIAALEEFAARQELLLLDDIVPTDPTYFGAAYDNEKAVTYEERHSIAVRIVAASVVQCNLVLGKPERSIEFLRKLGETRPEIAKSAWPAFAETVLTGQDYDLAGKYCTNAAAMFLTMADLIRQSGRSAAAKRSAWENWAGLLIPLAKFQKDAKAEQLIASYLSEYCK